MTIEITNAQDEARIDFLLKHHSALNDTHTKLFDKFPMFFGVRTALNEIIKTSDLLLKTRIELQSLERKKYLRTLDCLSKAQAENVALTEELIGQRKQIKALESHIDSILETKVENEPKPKSKRSPKSKKG